MKQCRKNYLCDFRVCLNNAVVQVERCVFCGRKEVYYKKTMNNRKYAEDHSRDLIQPSDQKNFEKNYGKEKLKSALNAGYKAKYEEEGFLKEIKDRVKNKKTTLL